MKMVLLFLEFILTFRVAAQNRNDIVIDEVMADPSPVVLATNGLPEAEFIELKNVSSQPYNLNGWTINDLATTATIRTEFILRPDSFVILCSTTNLGRFSAFGAVLGLSNFPSLDNDGELIFLRSKEGKQIHSILYAKNWYGNPVKSEGGWTLEMADPQNACAPGNWLASISPAGGTPGKVNSVNKSNPDISPPELKRAHALDSLHITVVFSEPLDSFRASIPLNYQVGDEPGSVMAASPSGPLFTKVILGLSAPLKDNRVYQVTAKHLTDCSGNEITSQSKTRVARASPADLLDVVINEILFNPRPDGVDYVEIYNRSKKTVDLKQLLLANRSPMGMISTPKQISKDEWLVFPGDYVVLTENAVNIRNQFNPKNPETLIEMDALPSYPDDNGTVLLMNDQGKQVDELAYDEDWHFKLIDNKEGVALERIDFNKPTQDVRNWHSAASGSGYGTPTYKNSQYMADALSDALVSVSPEVFSPDNDGREDFTTINYQFPEPGYVCNITIFNSNGKPVRYLTRNALCGLQGYFRWDGLDDKNNMLSMGMYIFDTSIFNLKGKTRRFKHPVVLARKLQ